MPAWKRGEDYNAAVLRAIDGDTLEVKWTDPNFLGLFPERIRLAGLDAPELRPTPQPGALAAQRALSAMVRGMPVTISPTRTWPDPYGRIIARVRIGGQDVTKTMIAGGWAKPYSVKSRKVQRILQKGLNPLSAIPTRQVRTPPTTTTGLPISRPSMPTGRSTTTGTQPHQV
jgi:endonuclease YncB( thermonuclease family)